MRISLGTPHYYEWAKCAPYVSELAPHGLLRKPRLPVEKFEARYRERLEKIGVERIEKRLAEVHAEYQRPLALICFEDVFAGQFCHRRVWATWWAEQTGQEIPEL